MFASIIFVCIIAKFLRNLKKSSKLVGGEVIGLELGSVWNRLDTSIAVVEILVHIPSIDPSTAIGSPPQRRHRHAFLSLFWPEPDQGS